MGKNFILYYLIQRLIVLKMYELYQLTVISDFKERLNNNYLFRKTGLLQKASIIDKNGYLVMRFTNSLNKHRYDISLGKHDFNECLFHEIDEYHRLFYEYKTTISQMPHLLLPDKKIHMALADFREMFLNKKNILVGSNSMACYVNDSADGSFDALNTEDVDILVSDFTSSNIHISNSLKNRDNAIRIDFLSNFDEKNEDIYMTKQSKAIGIRTTNIPYLSFLIKGAEENIMFTEAGCIYVVVPDMSRYILHKSYSVDNRIRLDKNKIQKDQRQIEGLIRIADQKSMLNNLINVYQIAPKRLKTSFKKFILNMENKLGERNPLSLYIEEMIEEVENPSSILKVKKEYSKDFEP